MGANMKLMVCAVAAMSMAAGTVQAGEWRMASIDAGAAILVDTSTIRTLPYSEKKVAWAAHVLPATSTDGEDYYLVQSEFDCLNMTATEMSFYSYSVEDEALSSSSARQRTEAIIPDSRGHDVFRVVCNGSDQVAADTVRDALIVYRDVLANPD